MKPMRAVDWDESKLRLPAIIQPKIDGVRGLNLTGKLTARSLKPHANRFTTSFYSHHAYLGFDGELAANAETHPALCRLTSSALRTIEGEPFTLWWLFDYLVPQTMYLPYYERYQALCNRVSDLRQSDPQRANNLRVVPYVHVATMDKLLAIEAEWLEAGYEGVIVRDPDGRHKDGKSTVREGGLLRIKRFEEAEATVIGLKEGQENQNEQQINELGRTFRSTHADGMVPNGQVGTLLCRDSDGKEFNVSPGEMDIPTRQLYYAQQDLIVGKEITYKRFPKGVKDKPRFPTFKCIREEGT